MLPQQCIILNSKFYLKNYRKNDIQLLLQKKHIKVPRILQYSEHYDYVIDINPASGLLHSSKARQYFAHSLRQISCKK